MSGIYWRSLTVAIALAGMVVSTGCSSLGMPNWGWPGGLGSFRTTDAQSAISASSPNAPNTGPNASPAFGKPVASSTPYAQMPATNQYGQAGANSPGFGGNPYPPTNSRWSVPQGGMPPGTMPQGVAPQGPMSVYPVAPANHFQPVPGYPNQPVQTPPKPNQFGKPGEPFG